MQRLCAAAVLFSRGTPFMLAGEEFLRSKGGNGNSYNAPDSVNNLDWEALTPDSDEWAMAEYYRRLITLRREHSFFTEAEISAQLLPGQDRVIMLSWSMNGQYVAYALLNPADEESPIEFAGGPWTVLLGESAEKIPAMGALLVAR